MEMADLGKKPENESFRASIKRKLKKSFRRERKGSNASQRWGNEFFQRTPGQRHAQDIQLGNKRIEQNSILEVKLP